VESLTKLNAGEVSKRLSELRGWTVEGGLLSKRFEFASFSKTFAFIAQVALLAERLQHHPNWSGVYTCVVIRLETHEAGGLTDTDFVFAKELDSFG
jgi:4a-hydroxytetrahydrobiopterin dehydratase